MSDEKQDAVEAGQSKPVTSEQQPDRTDKITDADRAANPIGVARRERETQRHRDDKTGQFAPKQEGKEEPKPDAQKAKPEEQQGKDGDKPNEPDAQQDQQQRKPGTVPQQALEAERRKRQERDSENENLRQERDAMRREMAEMRGLIMGSQRHPSSAPQPNAEPEKPPEFFASPEDFVAYQARKALDPVSQQVQQLIKQRQDDRAQISWMINAAKHGEDVARDAVQAHASLQNSDPAEFQRREAALGTSMDPVGDVVRWHKQQSTLQKLQGKDLDDFIKEEVARRVAEMQQQGAEQQHESPPALQRQPPPQNLPTSFAAQRSGGPRGGSQYGGPRALSEIMPRG